MAQFEAFGTNPNEMRAKGSTAAFKRRQSAAVRCLGSATEALAGFDRGTHVFGLTKGQFSMIDIASAVLAKTGPADVSVWTWCIAEYEVAAITAFMTNGAVSGFRLVMDWAGAQRDMPIVADLQAQFGDDCVRVTKSHAKIVTISTECGWRVVIRGSMNLNANPRFEQFDVSDDPAIYAVVDNMMAEMWARGRPLPVRRMVHADAVDLLAASDVRDAPATWMPAGAGDWWGNARQKAGRAGR